MSQRPLRVGVVGVGGIAQMMHLPTLAERPDLFEIVALADVSAETLTAVGRRYGVSRLFSDHRGLVELPEVEAVLLLASGSHVEPAIAALERGKHLFVEKPLGFGPAESEAIARAARGARGMLVMGYHKRYDPAYRRAREAVRALRDLRYVEVTVLHPDDGDYRAHHAILPIPEAPRPPGSEADMMRGAADAVTKGPLAPAIDDIVGADAPLERRIGGLILYQSLIHDVNLVRGVLGDPLEVVSSHVWRGGWAQTSLTRFPGDVRVNMTWLSVPGLKHYEETVRFVGPDERVTLVFPSPYLRHFPTPLTIERMVGGELVVEQRTVSYEEAFRVELLEFRAGVLTGTPPETTLDDALGDVRWIQALAGAYGGGGRLVG